MRILFTLLLTSAWLSGGYAQDDSLKKIDLSEVVITATRTEKMVSALPMPILVINQAQIKAMGSLRLNEILQEQTGLAIVTDHGQGVQMQGFSPDYTLILIDGEPLIGRTAGTLELSRIAVGNIKQIEIVKGPSSSLYGSEALAGVVNIITERPEATKFSLSSRYGTNQTWDISTNFNLKKEKWNASLFLNRYSTTGYDLSPEIFGQTVEPFANYTTQAKLNYDVSKNWKVSLSGRYFTENQQVNFNIGNSSSPNLINGKGSTQDFNFNPIIYYQMNNRIKTQFRFYTSNYQTESKLNYVTDNQLYDATFFKQNFVRPEIQTEYFLSSKHTFTFGLGKIWERVEATRYTEKKRFSTDYAFAQYDFAPKKWLNLIAGIRFDKHSVYGSQISPKISGQVDLSKKISWRASVGRGFKAPDFRQLYLNFNNAVAGYSVFGSEELPQALTFLQAQNQIAEVLFNPSEIGNLQAESSWAWNSGFKLKPNARMNINLNFFRNDIQNLIETQVVARKTNGQNVFSYRNLNRIYTQGLELDFNYQVILNLSLSMGYQYLVAKDKTIEQKIKDGEIFNRDPITLITTRVTKRDYGGLFNRSRNMLNVKAFYENPKWGFSANLRGVYRGRYGLGDLNGNLILDNDNEYVKGYVVWNIALAQEIWQKRLRVQVGANNVLNQLDPQNIPNLAGRLFWLSVGMQISQKETK
ncbi:MAG: TonB-dependent receptor [Microscillaceae bacterium]|jgi:outer membrane receptor for ferrienterochelin and colicins|nr:TonB-dependent receptor [Microscillaceae bacterium]